MIFSFCSVAFFFSASLSACAIVSVSIAITSFLSRFMFARSSAKVLSVFFSTPSSEATLSVSFFSALTSSFDTLRLSTSTSPSCGGISLPVSVATRSGFTCITAAAHTTSVRTTAPAIRPFLPICMLFIPFSFFINHFPPFLFSKTTTFDAGML